MKKWKTGYKAAQKQGNRYISFCYTGPNPIVVGSIKRFKTYGIGRVTKRTRGDGPLAVFGSKQKAKALIEECGHWLQGEPVLFRCRYRESNDKGFWQYVRGERKSPKYIDALGIFADEVELIEEVAL